MRASNILLALGLVGTAPWALGAGGTIFDNAGNVYASYDSTHWSDGFPGIDFDLPTPPDGVRRDVLRYSGFWVRPAGATQEARLGNPLLETYGASGLADFAYGCTPSSVCVGLERGRVIDRRYDLGSGVFVSELRLTNTSNVTTGYDVFHLIDPLVASVLPSETAHLVRPNLIQFTTSTLGGLYYRGSGLPTSTCAVDDFGSSTSLFAQLNDAGITNFGQFVSDVTSSMGVHCAMRWHFDLAPGAAQVVRISFSVGTGPELLFKGDFDLDGTADIFFEDSPTATTRLWPMKNTTRFDLPIDLPATPGFRVVGVDDFNQDLSSDLLLRRELPPYDLQVRKGDGVGFRPPSTMNVPNRDAAWELAATADFGQDGNADLLWRNTLTQKLEISLLDGFTQVGVAVPSPDQAVNANWKVVAASDADRDGDIDLLWYNTSSGKIVFWWLNDAFERVLGAFTDPPNAGDANWAVVASADFGRGAFVQLATATRVPDILWRNGTSNRLVVWHMNGSGQRTSGVFTSPDAEAPSWSVVGPR